MKKNNTIIQLMTVSKELNAGIIELVQFLESKGIKVELKPTSKITAEQYELLKSHFSSNFIKTKFEKLSGPSILGKIQLPIEKSQPVILNSLSELGKLKERQTKSKRQRNIVTGSWKIGKVKFFDSTKGFGFVECFDDNEDCFIHVSKIITPTITDNDYVVFKTIPSQRKKGQNDAVNLYKLSLFNSDYLFLEKSFFEHKINSLRYSILEILPIDSVFKTIESELKRIQKETEKTTVIAILHDIHFILASLKKEELKKGILELIWQWAKNSTNAFVKVNLWNDSLCDLPSIQEFKEVFNDVSDETKSKIINSVSQIDKVTLINSNLKSGLKYPAYYENIFKVIKSFINESNIFVFDLEYDGHNIQELAFTHNGEIISAKSQKNIKKALPQFKEVVSISNSFLAGHNIDKFDIPLLKEKIELPENIGIVDTLLLETILSPTLKSFALGSKEKKLHVAKIDVEHTLNLLTNQVIRLIHIPEKQLNRFEQFIDGNFINHIKLLRENITENTTELYEQFEAE